MPNKEKVEGLGYHKTHKRVKATVAPYTILRTQEQPPAPLENGDLNAETAEKEFRRLKNLLNLKYGADSRISQGIANGAVVINAQDLENDGSFVDVEHFIGANQIYTFDAFVAKMEDNDPSSSNVPVDRNVPLRVSEEIPDENEGNVEHITTDYDTEIVKIENEVSDILRDEVDRNVALSIGEKIPSENEENVEHITTDYDAEVVKIENEVSDILRKESSENSLAICGLCGKTVVNKIMCIKCGTPFHAVCWETAVSMKSSCQHVRIQDFAKNAVEQTESTEHLKLQIDLLKRLGKEMADKQKILSDYNKLLSEKVEWVEKKNKSLENKIQTLQLQNRNLKKINESLEKKVPLVSSNINK